MKRVDKFAMLFLAACTFAAIVILTVGDSKIRKPVESAMPTSREVGRMLNAPKYDQEDLDQAVLDRMWPKVEYLNSTSRYPDATLKRARYKMKCFQDWVNTIQDEQVKNAYQRHIDSFSRDYDKIEENNRTPKSEPVDAGEAERMARQSRADALQIPKPPKAMCLDTEKP